MRTPRPRTAVSTAAALAALALMATGCAGSKDEAASTDAGSVAPAASSAAAADRSAQAEAAVPAQLDFTAPTVDGKKFRGASLAGKDAVLWFWAPWCTVCRGEAPTVQKMTETYGDKVTFVGMPGRGRTAEMRQFVKDTGLSGFPQAIDTKGGLWSGFGVTAQPAFAFIDDSGKIDVVPGTLSEGDLGDRIEALTAS
jgi:thiol-disulfide isomerase/thioredoxin